MNKILIGFAGDTVIDRPDPLTAFMDVRSILKTPDMMFAHVECAYSNRPRPTTAPDLIVGTNEHNLEAFSLVGINVVSMAGNHILDLGPEAMLETKERLQATGVATCGAGNNEEEAHEPAICEAGGRRVAFLAYASVFPVGYEATTTRPGLAPMRAYNRWNDEFPDYYQPGCVPALTYVPDEHDRSRLNADIVRARRLADIVVTSFHWGDYSRPFHVTQHERATARYAIECGADMVVGHHHHTLRGMEWYSGKPILYGLGHLVADLRFSIDSDLVKAFEEDGGEEFSYRVGPRTGWPLLPLHKDSRMTVIAFAQVDESGAIKVGVLPCRLDPDGAVRPLRLGSSEANEVVEYLRICNQSQRFNCDLSPGEFSVAGYQTMTVQQKSQ